MCGFYFRHIGCRRSSRHIWVAASVGREIDSNICTNKMCYQNSRRLPKLYTYNRMYIYLYTYINSYYMYAKWSKWIMFSARAHVKHGSMLLMSDQTMWTSLNITARHWSQIQFLFLCLQCHHQRIRFRYFIYFEILLQPYLRLSYKLA